MHANDAEKLGITTVNTNIDHNFNVTVDELKNKQGQINLNNKIIDEFLIFMTNVFINFQLHNIVEQNLRDKCNFL